MKSLKPSVLLIGVFVCLPLLALYHFGVFKELSAALSRYYHENVPVSGELKPALLLQYGYYTAIAFLSAWVCIELPRQLHRFAFLLGLSFLTVTLSAVLALRGWLFEPFSGVAAILGAGLLGLAFSGSERGRRPHLFRQFFIDRLNEENFAQLLQNREPVKLTGTHEVTTLSCRLLNNPAWVGTVDVEEIEQMNSAFLKATAEFLVQRGAYLDTCNASGLSVQVGFPVADNEHALKACRLALELNDFLNKLSEEFDKRWQRKPQLGVALASGTVCGGLIGYGRFQFYSVLGEAPELSRRLCNLNAVYGSRLLLAASTFAAVKDSIEVRPMELLTIAGQTGSREVYELLGEKDQLPPEVAMARFAFWQGVVALRQGDAATALQKLELATVPDRDDPPLRYFKERAQALSKSGKSGSRRSEEVA